MSLPLSALVKELENPSSIVPVLQSVFCNVDSLHLQSKSELNHLVSRTLNLVQAHSTYNKWAGVCLVQILIRNYELLSVHGLKFINALIRILETTNVNTNLKLFNATVECLNQMADHIRGKPTLTREILTPKLPTIIQLFMTNIELNPTLIIKSLTKIMTHHPTTFRPFGNKLNAKLVEFIRADFNNYPAELKHEICQCYAFLPIIEKVEPETVWGTKLSNVLKEIVDILNIFKDLIDISHDEDLVKTLSNPVFRIEGDDQRLLPYLQIDLSNPETLLQLSTNLEILLHLLVGFITTDTKYCVRLPIGKIICVVGIVFGFNTNFLPFKRDIRDESITTLINSILINIQGHSLTVVNALIDTYQNPVIMYMNNLLALLETAIPMQKKSINTASVLKQESYMVELLATATKLLDLVQLYQEPQQLIRLVDMALLLVEPKTESPQVTNKPVSNGKKSRKKNTGAVPMADLLSHSHLFDNSISKITSRAVRCFINSVISRMELPSTQHYKIMRYIIVETVQAVNYSHSNSIPPELRQLLINSILYPGFEKVSILPIVTTILGDDPLVSVFNNARFPPLPILIKNSGFTEQDEDEDDDEEQDEESENVGANIVSAMPLKRTFEHSEHGVSDPSGEQTVETKKVKVQEEETDIQESTEPAEVLKFKQSEPQSQVPPVDSMATKEVPVPQQTIASNPIVPTDEVSEVVEQEVEEANSDFEMPSIDIDDDSDEE